MKIKMNFFEKKRFLILVEQVICCKLMPLQIDLYKKFVETGICELGSSNGKFSQSALSIITSLKKLCNRKLIMIFIIF